MANKHLNKLPAKIFVNESDSIWWRLASSLQIGGLTRRTQQRSCIGFAPHCDVFFSALQNPHACFASVQVSNSSVLNLKFEH